MSSILKILSDVECQVYCDFELKGDVIPGNIFRIEMRKGNYLLEFKRGDVVLLSKEYEMCSNDEERLLKVSLLEVVEKSLKEKRFKDIAALNVKVSRDYENNKAEFFLENEDTHEKTRIPYNVSETDIYLTEKFDECGLLAVNVDGVAVNEWGDCHEYFTRYEGGHWGCVDKLGNIQIPIIYDEPVFFHSPNITVAKLNDQLLFINKWNETVFENKWDFVIDRTPFFSGKCIVEKNGKEGVIDEDGNEILPLNDLKVYRIGEKGQLAVQGNNKWGLLDVDCKTLYPITLDSISYFYWPTDNYYVYKVKVGGKEGLLDSTGRLVFPIVFDEIKNTSDYILVKQNDLYGLYQREKQILPIEYDEIKHEITPANSKYDGLLLVSKKHSWGVIDSLGNIVVPIKYDIIEYNSGGRGDEGFVIKKDGKWGYISSDGNTIPLLYDSITIHEWHLKSLIVQQGERYGLISTKGEQLLPIEYLSISIEPIRGSSNYYGFIFVMGEDGLGIFTEDGSCIIKPEYKEICAGCGGFIVTAKDGEKGLFDKKGDTVLPVSFEDIRGIDIGIIATKSNGVWQLWCYSKGNNLKSFCWSKDIDSDPLRPLLFCKNLCWIGDEDIGQLFYDEPPTPLQFKSYKRGYGNQLIIEKNEEDAIDGVYLFGKYAVIDYEKCIFIISHCDDIQETSGDCYIFDRAGKKGLYNKEGVLLYGNAYDEIEVKNELIYTIQDGCYLIYDYDGEVVFDKRYKEEGIYYGEGGRCGEDRASFACIVTKDGKWGCLNYDLRCIDSVSDIKKVKEIIPCEYDHVAFQDKILYTVDTKEKDMWIMYFVKKENNGVLRFFKYQCHDNSADIIEEWVWPYANAHYLFIDTETTGLPKDRNAAFFESENWPYIVQISIIVLDSNMNKIGENNFILSPENYTIPQESTKIHGITNEYAKKYGAKRKVVLEYIRVLLQTVNYVVGHNVAFDISILKAELYRVWDREWGSDIWLDSPKYKMVDTMQMGAYLCNIPSTIKGEKYKWPTLDELYRKLFGKSFQGKHNAMNDVRATYECFCKMRPM